MKKIFDLPALADLEFKLANGIPNDNCGYSSKAELCSAIENLANFDDPLVRGYCMDIIFWLDKDIAFSLLIKFLSDQEEVLRSATIVKLGYYGDIVMPYLIPLLENDPSPVVRCNAAAVLGYSGSLEAIPALLNSATNDHKIGLEDSYVSSYASDAIKRIRYRYGRGADTYDSKGVRSLFESLEIDKENAD